MEYAYIGQEIGKNNTNEMNESIKINLQKLKNARLLTIQGKTAKKRCVCVPVDDNPEIFVGEKGIYLNLTAIEMKEPGQYGDTHIIKGNIPEETYRVMTEEERKAQPILGQMRPLARKEQPAPEVQAEADEADDMPIWL